MVPLWMKSNSKLGRVPLGLDRSARCLRSSISKHFVRLVNDTVGVDIGHALGTRTVVGGSNIIKQMKSQTHLYYMATGVIGANGLSQIYCLLLLSAVDTEQLGY